MIRYLKNHPVRLSLRAACFLLIAFMLYHIVGGYLPFCRCPELEDAAAIERWADAVQQDVVTSDRAMLLGTHADALNERIRLLSQAQEDIVIATYDLRDGESTRDVLSVALERADAGVRVRLLVDGISGRVSLSANPIFRALEAHPQIEIRFYNPTRLLLPWHNMGRMHDKYVIVDDLGYILGGRNMFDAFIGDYPVEQKKNDREVLIYTDADGSVDGAESSLGELRAYFESVWTGDACAGFIGEDLNKSRSQRILDELRGRYADLRRGDPLPFEGADYRAMTVPTKGVWLISNPTGAYAKQPVVFSKLCALMERAQHEIILHSPYAVLNGNMRERLSAIAEKTPLTLMVNAVEISHNVAASGDYLYHRGEVLSTGAELLEYAGDNYHHGKAAIIDDSLSIIGCYNLDLRSTYVDTELMVVVRGAEFNALLRENMEALHADCRRVIDADTSLTPPQLNIPPLSPARRVALRIVGALLQPVRNLV